MDQAEVLAFLQPGTEVSGADIADRLGVTRAAVAKAVTQLRQAGYEIEASTRRGYCLRSMPDHLTTGAIRALLKDHPWQQSVRAFDVVDSTNLQLKRAAADGAPAGTVYVAEQQTAGRGRMGRSFVSDSGVGIYLSVLLRPDCTPDRLMTLTAQTAVAIRRAIFQACGAKADIKWVNDLLLGGKKICGILTELSVEAESGRVAYAVVGIGVNCNQPLEAFPPELQSIAGSIYSQTGKKVDRVQLAAEMIRQLSQLPNLDWQPEYRAACLTLNREVEILRNGQSIPAHALDVGDQAELRVCYRDGSCGSVNSGEVSVRLDKLAKM